MRETYEGQLTRSEFFKVLSSLSKYKTPGNDGHTVEFYMFFWSEIGMFRIDSLDYAWNSDHRSCYCGSSKNVFRASTGFEPMASALALQCSTNWAMKTYMLGAGQFIEFIVPVKGMKHMNIMWTADIRMKWRSDHHSWDSDLSNRNVSPKMLLKPRKHLIL